MTPCHPNNRGLWFWLTAVLRCYHRAKDQSAQISWLVKKKDDRKKEEGGDEKRWTRQKNGSVQKKERKIEEWEWKISKREEEWEIIKWDEWTEQTMMMKIHYNKCPFSHTYSLVRATKYEVSQKCEAASFMHKDRLLSLKVHYNTKNTIY